MVALVRTGITSRCGTVTRIGELLSGSEDSYGDAKVWRVPLTFVLAPLPVSASLLRFLARRRRKQRSPEVRLGDVRLYTPTTLPSSRSSSSVLLCTYGSLGKSRCVAGRSWSVMIAVRRREEAACRLGGASFVVRSRDAQQAPVDRQLARRGSSQRLWTGC